MQIAGRAISSKMPPYLIAEASSNHCGDFNTALALISAAKTAGADAVKFQAYTPDTITLDCDKADFVIKDGLWKGRRLYELYQKCHTPLEWFSSLFRHARELGITAFASVFDAKSVDALEALECPAYKIASMEVTDTNLIGYVAKTGKPLIISTGMASEEEVFDASAAADVTPYAIDNVAMLACVSGYPMKVEAANLSRLKWLQRYYSQVGISDHTLGWEVPIAATALGATIIEKHLMIPTQQDPEDVAFSLLPQEFSMMADKVRRTWQAMQPSDNTTEDSSRQLRRSLYVVQDIKRGERFTRDNVRSIRPSYGLPPRYLWDILDKTATQDISYGTALKWSMVEGET